MVRLRNLCKNKNKISNLLINKMKVLIWLKMIHLRFKKVLIHHHKRIQTKILIFQALIHIQYEMIIKKKIQILIFNML